MSSALRFPLLLVGVSNTEVRPGSLEERLGLFAGVLGVEVDEEGRPSCFSGVEGPASGCEDCVLNFCEGEFKMLLRGVREEADLGIVAASPRTVEEEPEAEAPLAVVRLDL